MFTFRSPKCPKLPLLVRGNMGQTFIVGHLRPKGLKPYVLQHSMCPVLWDTLGHQNSVGQQIEDLGHLI